MTIAKYLGALACLSLLLTSTITAAQGLPLPDNSHDPGATAPGLTDNGPGKKSRATNNAKKKPTKKQKGWLGIGLKIIPKAEAKTRGYDHKLVRVDSVFGGSPAESSGFQVNDVIVEVDGQSITSSKQLIQTIGGHTPGDKIKIKLLRGKKVLEVPLLLGLHPGRYGLLRSRFIDKPAPALKINAVGDNKKMTLASLKGDVVVVDFWATWCGPCRKAIPKLNQLQKDLKGKGFRVVGVSDEERSTVQKFMKKTDVGYTMAYDQDRATHQGYLVSALPTLFVIDHNGVVRDVHIGAGKFDELRDMVNMLIAERDAKK